MPSSERPLEAGDLILVELSPSVEGQFVQICRTASIGKAPSVTQEKYRLLVAAMEAGIGAVRPGIRMSVVCEAINDHLSAAGYAEFSRPPFIRRRGHGLGSGSVWPGDVAVDNQSVLEEGMLFMVHPNQFLPETGYMMCGEPVVVRAGGAEILTRRTAQFDVIHF
jgi:Xaa-Pro aminopeptidase